MKMQFLDVVVAKEFETNKEGVTEKKTRWNRVGQAWASKNGEAMNLELFMFPGLRYSIPFNSKEGQEKTNE
jgi:hypothetical protein